MYSLGIDPGIKNSAYAVIKDKELYIVRMLDNPVDTINTSVEPKLFMWEMTKIIQQFKPEHIVTERFMARGARSQNQVELVSTMNGIIYAIAGGYYHTKFKFITASTWKNKFNKGKKRLEDLYNRAKGMDVNKHQIDATLLGMYPYSDSKYDGIDHEDLLKRIEEVS